MEKQIKIAEKLYRYRDTAKKFLGKEYPHKIKNFMDVISGYQKDHGLDVLQSVLAICSDPDIAEEEVTIVLFFAAAVEIIEPSF